MIKKRFLTVLVVGVLTASLFAHGKGDVEEKTAENFNSWQEKFDLDQKKPGKFNFLITAKDLGGNTTVEGPYNIWYDPKSDMPICGITNPYPNMRVVANLNIVGTCVDDDAVSRVELILDEGMPTEKRVPAEGKEFWSYYLDTTELEEGPHTIKAIGYDINDTPVQGEPTVVTWQLDRKLPLTAVLDKEMGILVSGNVRFDGVVSDGNGIKELGFSTDNGNHFVPVKLSGNKAGDVCKFSINVDTTKFSDGPSVLWFKAKDKAGSVGLYSFLYYIDNTKPDVKIVSPEDGQIVNGKFTIAGYARDAVGLTSLTWQFGQKNGEIELVPGNPYWVVEVDTVNGKEKSGKFSIKAVDRVNNIVEVSKTIQMNQEDDKPVVIPSEPEAGQIFGESDILFARGIAHDDDGVQSVKIQFDNNEPVIQETRGTYYLLLANKGELTAGKHTIKVSAIDINGVEGNPVVREISSMGIAPTFSDANLANGQEVHPEAGSAVSVTANSGIGLAKVHAEILIGQDVVDAKDVDLKSASSYKVSLPINVNFPKGVITFVVKATDTLGRESSYKSIFYVTNTSVVKADEPVIVFDDSRFTDEGSFLSVINNPEFPASGYLLGENALSAELVPATPFAKVELVGNQIKLIAREDAVGSSSEVVVRVKTDHGRTISSKPIKFRADTAVPKLEINQYSESDAINAYDEENAEIKISGTAKCETGVGSVKYRVLAEKITMKGGVIAAVAPEISNDFQSVTLNKDGSFSFTINGAELADGMYVYEVVAESAGGNKTVKGIAVSKIPALEEVNGKMPAAKPAAVYWLDGGYNVYAVGVYQGELSRTFQEFYREEMREGSNPVVMETSANGKAVVGKYNAVKNPTLSANFALINDSEYLSGTPVVMPFGAKAAGKVVIYIDTGASVNSVSYQISGDNVPGGANTQSGSAKLFKPTEENPVRWTAEIPLENLPARVNKINAIIKAGSLEQQISGSVIVIRENPEELIYDDEKIFGYAAADTAYDEVDNNYILADGSKYYYYANFKAPLKAEVVSSTPGLTVEVDGNFITLSAEKDGIYKDVKVRVTDRFGDAHNSPALNFIADSNNPDLNLSAPELHAWVKDKFTLSGTAADALGVRKVEYSLDNGETWTKLSITPGRGVTFSQSIDVSGFEDGLIRLNVRAYDNAGHEGNVITSIYKDVTPPTVKVVVPGELDVVNGQNLIVFDAKDNGFLEGANYIAPPVRGKEKQKIALEMNPLISTFVGTPEKPIDDAMSFEFYDAAGNKTMMEAWEFDIDNESDLPRAEIHVPEDMQVVTRDFEVSGVIYDDDGDSTVFYKIDNGSYKQVSVDEIYMSPASDPEYKPNTSFAIKIPLETMTDNEHTITLYAVDVNGVKGEEVTRTFRVSLEEPKGGIELPTIDTTVRGFVTISGWASDKNGIDRVQVSLDNGNSYNDAVGAEKWSYKFDTRAIPGGTQVVFIKVWDKYGIEGLYSSLINIDNDAPTLLLELPLDDSTTTGNLFFSGNVYDNVEVTELYVTIRNLDRSSKADVRKIKIDRVIGEAMNIKDLSDGFYNVELTAKDKAGNVTNVSRNIRLDKARPPATVDLLYPLNGEHKNGVFTIYGQSEAEGELEIDMLKLYVDNKFVEDTQITPSGFFKFDMSPEKISEGTHVYRVDTVLKTGAVISSREQTVVYNPIGPWVTIDNFTYGDFATGRPYIKGQAGYSLSEDELLLSKTKSASPELKAAVQAKKVARIDVSFDNGKTFKQLSKNEQWMYRVENADMQEGYHFFLVRATMANGEVAITRTIVQIDNTSPTIRLIAPSVGGRYNQMLTMSGLAKDDVSLEDVTVSLRKGDKSSYEIPSFIQGLYLDFHFWGATLFDIGAGLTFFNDVVKVQFQYGQFTQSQRDAVSDMFGDEPTMLRYGGHVLGVKILANVAEIPFSYFFGHDFDWLYGAVAVGANFSWFTETNSGKPQILSALLAQIELPKVKLSNVKMFSSFSFYTEASIWFIPTDVSSSAEIKNIIPQISIGIRTNVF